jgi:sterol desaturase/sphingolipid hydroxylase (fatty acid hydroxylase superfamily)
MISAYKQYTELAGHSGKMLSPASSFPQFIWLPRLFNIQLYAEDHDLHHKVSNCNFAKRFSLWDKVFGTYLHKNN